MRIFFRPSPVNSRSAGTKLASDFRGVGAEVVVQADFQQQGRTLLEKLETYIAECDRVIALVGNVYA